MQSIIFWFPNTTDPVPLPFNNLGLLKHMNSNYQKAVKHVKNICRFVAIHTTCITNENKKPIDFVGINTANLMNKIYDVSGKL